MRKIYLSGPVRGMPDLNRPAFAEAERFADGRGWLSVNPHDLTFTDPDDIRDVMDECVGALLRCDAILLLPGWRRSDGALAEWRLALAVGMPAYHVTARQYGHRILPDITAKPTSTDKGNKENIG